MNGPSRSGHLTYYEQLGVPSNASMDEVRDAYRALARMLHPDQQTDPHLKLIAEQQMRKLNPIYTVLSDPVRRRQYDEDLAEEFAPAIALKGPPVPESRLLGRIVWGGTILLAGGLLYWLASSGGALPFGSDQPEARSIVPIFIPQTKAAEPPPAGDGALVAQLKMQVQALTAERDFAIHELTRLKSARAPESAAVIPSQPALPEHHTSAPASALTELPATQARPLHPEPVIPPKPAAKPAAKPTLAGFWFYTAPKFPQKGKNQALYPPDFIEATIVEENGVVKGKYRSRFQVTDRAAYPEVNFTFTGTPNGMTLTCPWVGQGGARGEVTMKMTSDNSLRLDWAASEMGSQLAMASGTAILTRRID